MSRLVHVVAAGARTPVGLGGAATAAAVRAGICRIREHPFAVDLRGRRVLLARDACLDAGLTGAPRLAALAQAVLDDVAAELAETGRVGGDVPLLVGLPEPRPGWGEREASSLVRALEGGGALRFRATPSLAGHASALDATRIAAERIGRGEWELCVVGAVDSHVDPDALLWVDGHDRLLAEGVRSGFPPGEGAAFFALASEAARRGLGLPSLAVVRSAHAAREKPLASGEPNLGEGLAAAIAGAVAALARGEVVDAVFCDLNGERHRLEEWGFALLRAQEALGGAPGARTGAGSYGDAGAAAGALSIVLAIEAWRRGFARGPRALVWGSSDGGLRAAAVLERQGFGEGACRG